MPDQDQHQKRPFSIACIALFQGALAASLFFFTALAIYDPARNLGYLRSALRILIGRTDYVSYASSAHNDVIVALFFQAAGALWITGNAASSAWGLWALKKWARHAVVAQYGVTLCLWARSFLFFGIGGGFSDVPMKQLQPIYVVIFLEAVICLTVWGHGGVAEAFGEPD